MPASAARRRPWTPSRWKCVTRTSVIRSRPSLSSCGKTTLLRSIGGLEAITEGRILIDGRDVTKAQPSQRDLAMVFQNYALYPHMTVRQNLGYALRVRKLPKKEINRRVEETAR